MQHQAELRMHDLSDGMFIPGIYSKPRIPGGISGNSAQLRTVDGQTLIDLAPGKITLTADEVIINGRSKAIFTGGGPGFAFTAAQIDKYEDGVPVVTHAPPTPT